jgi:ParB family chromosome partitioning protein
MAASAAVESPFRFIPLDAIEESKANPRKTFEPEALEELAVSIKAKGVLQPILVRPQNGHFELVAGARRVRAAKKAGLKDIPAVVRELSDEQALEAMVIENLQRADIHPLEEAEGYQALLKFKGCDVPGIAKKVGKSASYVYQRLKLAELSPSLKEAFTGGAITPGHAIELARLQREDQEEVKSKYLFIEEYSRATDSRVRAVVPVRELRTCIAKRIHRSLASAPWKKDDATLLAKAGPCTTCPFRAANQPDAPKKDGQDQTCTKPSCYEEKLRAYAERKVQELRKIDRKATLISDEYSGGPKGSLPSSKYDELSGKQKDCLGTTKGVFVDGAKVGQVVRICAAGERCKVHNTYHSTRSSTDWAAQSRAEARRKFREAEVARRVMDAFLPKVKAFKRADLEMIARSFFGDVWHERRRKIAARHGWSNSYDVGSGKLGKMSDQDLVRLILEIACTLRRPDLFAASKRHGVNAKRIEKAYLAELKAKKAKKKAAKAAKASAKKKR